MPTDDLFNRRGAGMFDTGAAQETDAADVATNAAERPTFAGDTAAQVPDHASAALDGSPDASATMVVHEERLQAGAEQYHAGTVRVKKHVEHRHVEDHVPRQSEEAEVERVPASEGDSGQVEELPDGSVSVPVLEEEIVVTKRTVVRERIIIRKRTLTEQFKVAGEVRVEHAELEATDPELLEEATRDVR